MNRTKNLDRISDNDARTLLVRFLDADTTGDEEKILYDYFADNNVLPEDLIPYREMMLWYANGLKVSAKVKESKKQKIWIWLYSAAASIAIIIAIASAYIWHIETESEKYAMYEGSYIIRNGQKYSDLREIMPKIKEAEATASYQEQDIENIVYTMPDDPKARQLLIDLIYN